MVNIRTKGANGEREICDKLNSILESLLLRMALPLPPKPVFQRNQNQSAVGGSDITNPFGLCIEVKRHETLNVTAWWGQVLVASKEFGGVPVLLYRQSGKRKWNCVLMTQLAMRDDHTKSMTVQSTIDDETFSLWVEKWMYEWIMKNGWRND